MQVTDAVPGSRDVDDAARIWAEATAARDGGEEVAALSISRPVIAAVLASSPAAFLLIARSQDGTAVGFAAVRPAVGPRARPARPVDAWSRSRAEVSGAELAYFGVRPSSWGRGVGVQLLRALRDRLTAGGYRRAKLLVYADNVRAIELYEQLGWRPAGQPAPHPRTGKPEQRYELEL